MTTPRFLRFIEQRLLSQPAWLLAIFVIAWLAWLAWSGWQAWPDTVLPPERVTAKQIRVNTGQYNQLQTSLRRYHQPTAPASVTNGLFVATPPAS